MSRLSTSSMILAAIPLACIVALVLPGQTVATAYVNDLLIFLDGAHRIVWGQVPNRDFHTSLGPLVYYIPALGLVLSGTFGGAMPVGMAVMVGLFGALASYVLMSRLRAVLALPLYLFLIVLLAAPLTLGENISAVSFAMYYNRIGWVALALLMIMYLEPVHLRRFAAGLDVACASLLVLVQIYSKATYGLVALAFLAFMLIHPRQRRWAAASLLLTLISMAVVEFFWRSSWEHVQDLRKTAAVSGGALERLVPSVLRNLSDLLVFGLIVCLVSWRRIIVRDLMFYAFCIAAGILIVSQNAQGSGIVTFYIGAAVAAERALASTGPADEYVSREQVLVAGAPFLMLLLLLPRIVHHGSALILHTALATSSAGQSIGLKHFDQVRLAKLWSAGDNGFSQIYVRSFAAGAALLEDLGQEPARVIVLDFVNPFSAGLGIAPPTGDASWLHWRRNVDAEHHPPPEELFANASLVMAPKVGINYGQLRQLYGPYLEAHFDLVRDTEQWTLFSRREEGR